MSGSGETAAESGDPGPERRGWGGRLKALGANLAPTLVILVALEIVLRVGAFVWYDFSRYHLLYGVHALAGRVGVSPWWVYNGGHYKFPPDYVLINAAGQGAETASTNSLGFRGRDFDPVKPPNTFRVITLGGSSTFGFHNSDRGTYPWLLQDLLAERSDSLRVEVINGGFPYYNTGSIRSLLEEELWNYDPDVITMYAGYNDTSWPTRLGPGMRTLIWIQQHSITYLLLKEAVLTDARVYSWKSRLRRELDDPQERIARAKELEDALLQRGEALADRYRMNLLAIADQAEARGVRLVLIRQPMTTRYEDPGAFPSYEAEYQAVRARLADGALLTTFEGFLVLHHRLMDELGAVARERGLPVMDNIALVDRERDHLASWVHLTEEGNARLAEALSVEIPYLLPGHPSSDHLPDGKDTSLRRVLPGGSLPGLPR